MNKSFSKIRHIQESNSRLEKRLLGEQIKDLQDEVNRDIEMEYLRLVEMCENFYEMLDGNPEKYFKKFRGFFNDDEKNAKSWFQGEWKKNWGETMDTLLKSSNNIIRKNTQDLKNAVDDFTNYLGKEHFGNYSIEKTIILTHPLNKGKSKKFIIKFNYM